MDRATKLLVLGSTALALVLLTDLNSRANPLLFPLSTGAFALACLGEALLGEFALSVVLSLTYLVPALYLATVGILFRYTYASPWIAALLGAIVVRSARTGWAFPRPFKAPLVLWALSLALTWPILVARELDFTPALLFRFDLGSSRSGIPPPVAIEWLLSVTCTASVGLLVLDALFVTYGRGGLKRFESYIVWPLFAGCLIGSAIAAYQSAGHMAFLNPTVYGSFGRASGTMLDANAFGTVVALWLPVAGAQWLESVGRRFWAAALWTGAIVVLAVALWATGSRTALLLAVVAVAVLAVSAWPLLRARRGLWLAAFALVAVAVVGAMSGARSSSTGPLGRLSLLAGDRSPGGMRNSVYELWRRNGYGTAATQIVIEHPLVGIGVGGFHGQASDALFRRSGQPILTPDNAQNWYRHQLAELGILGSVGWIAWTFLVVWTIARGRFGSDSRAKASATAGALLGFGLASLFGMPAQDGAVSITFFVFVFWCLRMRGVEGAAPSGGSSRLAGREWAAVCLIAGVFTAGTAVAARQTLRPPYRALAASWPYRYGFFEYEDPDNAIRWTSKKAVEVFPTERRWLKLVVGGGPPEGPPLDVTIHRDRDQILRFASGASTTITRYLRVPGSRRQVMIEIAVNRLWNPSAYGQLDRRGLGVRVDKWSFVDEPPSGAERIE